MARLVSSIINAARDRHVAFDDRRNPSGPLFRFLAQYTAKLSGKVALIDPDAAGLTTETNVALNVFDFNAGMVLGAGRFVTEVLLIDKVTAVPQQTYPIDLIDPALRFAPNGPARAAWQMGNVLYLRGRAVDWQDYGSIAVRVVGGLPAEGANEARLAAMALPDESELACIENVALFMARRGHADPKLPPIDIGVFKSEAAEAEEAYLDIVRRRVTGRVFFTQDVYRP